MERALIGEYEKTVEALLEGLNQGNHALAVEIASLPEHIRGFGHIKAKSVEAARKKQAELMGRYRAAPVRAAA
jgi:indolepyruvate ferredoxin oxidoreductase